MGLFDFLKGKNSAESAERALMRHAERVMDKRAMSTDRFESIEYLSKLGSPEAWRALLPRFNFVIDPGQRDREEKQFVFEAVAADPENALEPVLEYLRVAQSLTWPIKMLRAIAPVLPREEFVAELVDFLGTFDTEYEKNSERKAQIIATLEEEADPRIVPAVLPFLADFNEDVRFHAVRAIVAQNDPAAAVPLVKLLLDDTSARIRSTVVEGVAERGWTIEEDQRGAVAQVLQTVPTGPWVVTRERKIARATRL